MPNAHNGNFVASKLLVRQHRGSIVVYERSRTDRRKTDKTIARWRAEDDIPESIVRICEHDMRLLMEINRVRGVILSQQKVDRLVKALRQVSQISDDILNGIEDIDLVAIMPLDVLRVIHRRVLLCAQAIKDAMVAARSQKATRQQGGRCSHGIGQPPAMEHHGPGTRSRLCES